MRLIYPITLKESVKILTLSSYSQSKNRKRAIKIKIQQLSAAGIPAWVMVAPVIPGLTDHEMPGILQAAADAGATFAGYVMLRLPYQVKDLFVKWLTDHLPERASKVIGLIRGVRGGKLYDSRFGVRLVGEGPYAEHIGRLFEVSCRRFGLNRHHQSLSTAHFRAPGKKQLDMFM